MLANVLSSGASTWRPSRTCCLPTTHRHEGSSPPLCVCAAKKPSSSSPWATGPGSSKKGGSSNTRNTNRNKSKGKGNGSGKSSSNASQNGLGTKSVKGSSSGTSGTSSSTSTTTSESSVPNGTTFGSSVAAVRPASTYKLTAPLTPQLLDELSAWEVSPAPLWSTFTGHSEGEWLGQYAAYTPWGGDPEPVWADESGAQLMYAYSRASETRQIVPVSSSSSSLQQSIDDTAAAAAIAAEHGGQTTSPEQDNGEGVDMLVRSTLRSASIGSLIGATSAAAVVAANANQQGATAHDSAAAADDESEGFAYNSGGAVVFTGGSYSLGPEQIAVPEVDYDEWAAAIAATTGDNGQIDPQQQEELYAQLPHTTVVCEHCLVSSGDARLRLVTTLKIRHPPGEQEMDVELARLLLYKEHWYGTAEAANGNLVRKSRLLDRQSDTPADSAETVPGSNSSNISMKVLQLLPSHKFDVPVISMSRPQPQQLTGRWNVFVMAATPIVEENPDTLQEEQVWVYSSREEQQQWHVPGITNSAVLGDSILESSSDSRSQQAAAAAAAGTLDDGGAGGSFWLPGGAVVTLRMVPIPSSSADGHTEAKQQPNFGSPSSNGSSAVANSSNSSSSKQARGLMIGLHWLIDDGSCEFVERQYDPDGELFEVRHGSAVLGGWCGGRS